jgi:two-component system chemotaxis response regulator CheB
MRVLVVDDSVVFRTQITSALSAAPGIEVAGTAPNGRIALQRLSQMPIDLITLDMEMPEMDGMETLKALRAQNNKIKVIVFSSQTLRGAEKALEALREGADDVVAKPSGDSLNFESALESVKLALLPKVLQFTDQRLQSLKEPQQIKAEMPRVQSLDTSPPPGPVIYLKRPIRSYSPEALVIASSTGGPTALEAILSKIQGPYKLPVFIAQHMPPVFTQILARRLNELTGVPTKEAVNGDFVNPNNIYVAPGDFHLRLHRLGENIVMRTSQDGQRNSVRPAADFLFETAAEVYKSKCLGLVLTGMGEDGCDGAKTIKEVNGGIIIQNKESSTVFGMPGAVFECGAYDEIGNLEFITQQLNYILKGL